MKTKEQVTKEFTAELRALLAKYEAEIEIDDRRSGVSMTATIPGIYDDKGKTLRELTEIDLGRWLHSA